MYQTASPGMQEVIQMCSTFESNKSTKGASKLRRDLINGEIANLRDLLPLPSSTRQRLSQLQLMALVCVYVRKANYFQQVFKRFHELGHPYSTPNIGFSKALSGFLIMMTQNGKLLYISDNAAEYLGHSMEDLLIHGDSVYDIIDKADHGTVQAELLRNSPNSNLPGDETRLFLCRMNVSRNARRQMRFGDQKVVLLQGHYLSYLPLCSRNEPVFVATCTPVAMPETRECVVQGATNVFTSIHAMDMKFMHIDRNGEYYLGYTRLELGGISWYELIHWNYIREAQSKHRLISQSEQEKSCILLVRLQTRSGGWIWVHCVLQVKDSPESAGSNTTAQPSTQQSVIVATNQVLSEREAAVMRANAWIYHYYTVQTKLQYGLAYPEGSPSGIIHQVGSASPTAARLVAAAAYFPTTQQLINYGSTSPQSNAQHQISPDPSSNGAYGSPPLMTPAPPYAGTLGHPYNYHHRHTYEMSPTIGTPGQVVHTKKETPLDFSLAGSPMPPFDFHLTGTAGYPPGSTYWAHHHSQYHAAALSAGSGGSYLSRGSDPSTTSGSSPQTWSPPGHHTGSSSKNHHLNTLSTSNLPGHSLGSSKGRKRSKKHTVESVLERSQSPHHQGSPLTPEGALARRLYSPGYYSNGGGDPTVLTVSPFPYHSRSRSYKVGMCSDDSGFGSNKDESMLSCPLTPSPIWEGQTQREIQFYSESSVSGGSALIPGVGPDMIHCFPTYHHSYIPFCATPTQSGGFNGGATYNVGLGYYASNCSGTTGPTLLETGSPNKENRLPPTPESSDHDGETEERPLKWEAL